MKLSCVLFILLGFSVSVSAQEKTDATSEPDVWRYLLIDADLQTHLEEFSLSNTDLPETGDAKWSITMKALAGGKQDGVRLISVVHENLSFSVIPTLRVNQD